MSQFFVALITPELYDASQGKLDEGDEFTHYRARQTGAYEAEPEHAAHPIEACYDMSTCEPTTHRGA